jgi:beta-N-acetylhexosaminidase
VDPSAVSFSRFWLSEILRNRLNFNGIIFSDDLNMEGANISANYADRVIAAREAGCDFVLLCQNQPGVIQVLDQLPFTIHQVEKHKWGLLQGDFSRNEEPYQNQSRWQKTRHLLENLE